MGRDDQISTFSGSVTESVTGSETEQTGSEDAIAPAPTPEVSPNTPAPTVGIQEEAITPEPEPDPDYNEFPITNQVRRSIIAKMNRASEIKEAILAIDSSEDYFNLRDNSNYSRDELNWVLCNCFKKIQRRRLTQIVLESYRR